MYLQHFGLKKMPFSTSPDPTFLWLGDEHKEALSMLKFGIIESYGFLLLTGDVGTGKTTILKHLMKLIDFEALVATMPDPDMDPMDFFNYLAEEFKMEKKFTKKGDFLIHFKQFLLSMKTKNKKVLLL